MLNARADRLLVRAAGRSQRFVALQIRAPQAPKREGRSPVHLAFVLDRSGSMHGEKIARAREAVVHGIRSLRDEDRFAVVAYDDQVEVAAARQGATAGNRSKAAEAVARIAARNATDLCGGWLRGCEEIAEGAAFRRCLLLTDGLANHGVVDPGEITRLAANWRDKGVTTSTMGVGEDFDEALLRRMADAGGGNFHFIESAVQIPDFVAGEVGEALEVTVREAVLVVAAGPGVLVESLNDFPCRVDGDVSRIALGSLYSGQELQPVLRLVFPAGAPGASRAVTFRLEDHRGALEGAEAVLTFTWASHGENDRQPHDRDVLRLVAAAHAARAERDALERNAAGDFGGARAILMRCARRIERYGQGDETLRDLARSLREKAALYSRDLDSLSRKASYALASSSLKGRLAGPGRAHSHSGGGGGAPN